jgi:hypothetical protein
LGGDDGARPKSDAAPPWSWVFWPKAALTRPKRSFAGGEMTIFEEANGREAV